MEDGVCVSCCSCHFTVEACDMSTGSVTPMTYSLCGMWPDQLVLRARRVVLLGVLPAGWLVKDRSYSLDHTFFQG